MVKPESRSDHSLTHVTDHRQANSVPSPLRTSDITHRVIMPSYKLVYFNARGRAETARMLFAQAGVEYEDCRVTGEQFGAMKGDVSKCPLGQLPVLMVDDKPVPQSAAIERHLARSLGMYGKDEMEATRIDIACECVKDLFTLVLKFAFEKDESKKADLKKSFVEKDTVTILTAMTEMLKKNGDGKGFFVGDKMSLADIAFFNVNAVMVMETPDIADKYPLLKEFSARMSAMPKLAEWIAKRPESAF